MCGGSIEIVSCSRVGHIFRSKTPYTLPGGSDYVVWHNTARLVDVWLDQWKHFYYALHPGATLIDRGPVDARIALRKQLNCKVHLYININISNILFRWLNKYWLPIFSKSFQWYLDNIYPESQLPRDYYLLGDLRSAGHRNHCLDTSRSRLRLQECTLEKSKRIIYDQLFLYSKQNKIVNDEKCLDGNGIKGSVGMVTCSEHKDRQRWLYDSKTLNLINMADQRCLDIKPNHLIVLDDCHEESATQKWLLQDNFEWHSSQHISNQFHVITN